MDKAERAALEKEAADILMRLSDDEITKIFEELFKEEKSNEKV